MSCLAVEAHRENNKQVKTYFVDDVRAGPAQKKNPVRGSSFYKCNKL
jgi:hypothetical protein